MVQLTKQDTIVILGAGALALAAYIYSVNQSSELFGDVGAAGERGATRLYDDTTKVLGTVYKDIGQDKNRAIKGAKKLLGKIFS